MKAMILAAIVACALSCSEQTDLQTTEQAVSTPPAGGWVLAGPYFCADNFNPLGMSYAPTSYWPVHGYCRWMPQNINPQPAYRVSACTGVAASGVIEISDDTYISGKYCARVYGPIGSVYVFDSDLVQGNGWYTYNPYHYDQDGTSTRIRSIRTFGKTFLETCEEPQTYSPGPVAGWYCAHHSHLIALPSTTTETDVNVVSYDVVSFQISGSL
jgi:hypothetical protein